MITPKQAHLAAAYGFKVEYRGEERSIIYVDLEYVYTDSYAINFKLFGSTAFILTRNLDSITKTIAHDGESFVPIVELAKSFGCGWGEDNISIKQSTYVCSIETDYQKLWFDHKEMFFKYETLAENGEPWTPSINQQLLFDLLNTWRFNFGLDESICKTIKGGE